VAKIEVGRFVLSSYPHGWEVREKRDTKGNGATYYPSLSAALYGLQERRLRQTHAATLKELRAEVAAFRAEVAAVMGTAGA
jgi:hypothetical protein